MQTVPTTTCPIKRTSNTFSCNLSQQCSNLISLGRNITWKLNNQKLGYFPPHLTCASALPGRKQTTKHLFYTNAMLVLCQTSTNLINSWLILTLLYDSLILAINWLQLWATGGGRGRAQENWSWEFCTAAVELCCMSDMPVHCPAERQIVIYDVFDSS